MKEFENITFSIDNGLALLTFNRPEVLNAVNADVLTELKEAIDIVKADASVNILVLTGAGKAFVAGADIKYMSTISTLEARAFTRYGQGIINSLVDLDIPTIAAINGFAFGAGAEITMACDIRIASEKAKFGMPEVSLGIIPGYGGTQRLPKLVGDSVAKHMIFTGDPINAEEAYRIGLVSKVLPLEGFLDEVLIYARKILANATIAVRQAKLAVNKGWGTDVITGVAFEAEASAVAFSTEDRFEGMKAFLEKRSPEFKGK
ncbi:MAG: enoyl-CoA hydratase/isomerase family protein [Clostridiales Family XIII bacterium]|jgi:enoyl-CoA hydratase|nr:enoyl-CoA hydratase/isomerase family protein [Clostridiales Family XIII bacterium]